MPFGGGTSKQASSTKPPETMFLSAVRVDSQACADRIIFDFKPANGASPGYAVEYRPADEAQTEDASGNHIPIAGNTFLVVRFEPAATADISGGTLDRTYTGPRTIAPAGMHWVRQISKTGDFEAVLTWVIGVDGRRPFTATVSGSRVVLRIT